jgi:hypothetical protein
MKNKNLLMTIVILFFAMYYSTAQVKATFKDSRNDKIYKTVTDTLFF